MKPKSAPEVPPAFDGFSAAAFTFFRDLAENQNRDWFQEHKAVYEKEALAPMQRLVSELGQALAERRIPLCGDPKRAVFRINRDIRFSQDKSPYKTHLSAALTRYGDKLSPGVLYLHIDPKGSFMAAGFYQPPQDALQAIRYRAAGKPDDLQAMLAELSSHRLILSSDEESLKRLPRGFEQVIAADVSDFVRRKSFVVSRPLTQKVLKTSGLIGHLTEFAEHALPLLNFGWKAIDKR